MGWVRTLGFAALYFSICIAVFAVHFLYLIASHMTIYSYTLDWVMLNPQIALRAISVELARSPLLLPSMILLSLILGFTTDGILSRKEASYSKTGEETD